MHSFLKITVELFGINKDTRIAQKARTIPTS
ncbi:hypothetical protein F383_05069 [Gossypium arboreum]|uniref:Uncharacterized protein n=1 Tax=Gossypium arboreum TaxID=29729 RepID=A0A0B0PUL1_GOSAR|nr:hypothetical protein F383_05069 [Gossypium arboreum]